MGAVGLSRWGATSGALTVPWYQVCISPTYHSLPLLSGASSHLALVLLRRRPRWWDSGDGPGRMCCNGAEGNMDPGSGREVEAKQRLQRWGGGVWCLHCPIPSSCSHFSSSSPDPNKSGTSQPGWRLSKVFCPRCLAIVLVKCDEKTSEVPSYLPRKRGLVSREQSP